LSGGFFSSNLFFAIFPAKSVPVKSVPVYPFPHFEISKSVPGYPFPDLLLPAAPAAILALFPKYSHSKMNGNRKMVEQVPIHFLKKTGEKRILNFSRTDSF